MNKSVPPEIDQKLQKVRQPLSESIFHKKFSYDDYVKAHEWLDTIFKNGKFVDDNAPNAKISTCARCQGACCSHGNMVGEGHKALPTLVWNEHIYFEDPEFVAIKNGFMVCGRKDKANCNDKLILCKIHPFYPAKIHILEEECDFSIYIASYSPDRKMCTSVEYQKWQMEELSLFFKWLYGVFPENRLTYISHFFIDDHKTMFSEDAAEKVHDAFFKGYECSVNKIYRP